MVCRPSSPYSSLTFPFFVVAILVRRVVYEKFRPEFPQIETTREPLKQLIESCWHQDPASRPTAAATFDQLSLFQLAGLNPVFPF